MIASRNDQCPCGSGKKYKKCCLRKENIVQINEVKEERFFQQKHRLVEKMVHFFEKNIPFSQFCQLESEFNKKASKKAFDIAGPGFFQFWFHFFKRFNNGLRGIEWFYEENKARLSPPERTMAENWTKLQLKLVQAIAIREKEIVFEEILTKETFIVPNIKENVADFLPWYGTLGLLEPFENHCYFNGVSAFKGPQEVHAASEKINELMKKTGLDREQVLVDYYPEILATLLADDKKFGKEEQQPKAVHEYTIDYKIENEQVLAEFLYDQVDIVIDQWEEEEKNLSWIGTWQAYTDNGMDGEIYLAEVDGGLSLQNDRLTVICREKQKVNKWKEKIQEARDAVTFLEEHVILTSVPFNMEIKSTLIKFDENIPPYFALYAQNAVSLKVDVPLPQYNNYTIRELIETGREGEAESWLRQMEYSVYRNAMKEFGKVDVTADFNTVRKELGLPSSPFVTGGEDRVSSIKTISSLHTRPVRVDKEDIPYYEALGFTPDTVDPFYTKDLVAFYKEKTEGKGEGTIRKYRNSLFDLREILEHQPLTSWEDCSYSFWERLLAKDFFDFNGTVSKTRLKEFLSTIKAFTKWIDQHHKTTIENYAATVIQEMER